MLPVRNKNEELTMSKKKQNLGTISLHAGQVPDPTTGSRTVPLYQTTSYVFKSAEHAANLFGLRELGNIYTRLMNPTTDVFEKRVAAVEGGNSAIATASGAAAITYAILNITRPGDEIVSADNLYGGTYEFFHYTLPKLGRHVIFVDSTKPEALAEGVIEILRDEQEWERMSEAGRKAVKERWNWEEMEKRLFNIYEELLRNR